MRDGGRVVDREGKKNGREERGGECREFERGDKKESEKRQEGERMIKRIRLNSEKRMEVL